MSGFNDSWTKAKWIREMKVVNVPYSYKSPNSQREAKIKRYTNITYEISRNQCAQKLVRAKIIRITYSVRMKRGRKPNDALELVKKNNHNVGKSLKHLN